MRVMAVEDSKAAKAGFADKSAELGIEDNYAQIASTLHYHLTQKCVDNPGALEIIKEGKSESSLMDESTTSSLGILNPSVIESQV